MDNGGLKEITKEEIEQEKFEDDKNRQYVLKGGVVHLGKSPHVGHYVAFANREIDGEQHLCYFNDEKVWKTKSNKIGQSYLLLFEKN